MLAPAAAAEVSHGELAGHIRSSGYPCAHVLQVSMAGDSAWDVECNSGAFSVSRDSAGSYTVTPGPGVTREHGADVDVDADDR